MQLLSCESHKPYNALGLATAVSMRLCKASEDLRTKHTCFRRKEAEAYVVENISIGRCWLQLACWHPTFKDEPVDAGLGRSL